MSAKEKAESIVRASEHLPFLGDFKKDARTVARAYIELEKHHITNMDRLNLEIKDLKWFVNKVNEWVLPGKHDTQDAALKLFKKLQADNKRLEDENQRLADMSKRLIVGKFEIKNLILNHLANVTCDCGGGQRAPLCFLHQALNKAKL